MATPHHQLVQRIQALRDDPERVAVEGFHALKHALRFGAHVEAVYADAAADLRGLEAGLAPGVLELLQVDVEVLPSSVFGRLIEPRPPVPILSVVQRPRRAVEDTLREPGPLVLLERPRHLGNVGTIVRTAAAARAGGVITTGRADPWHPVAIRAAAGLQFALPVHRLDGLPRTDRPVLAYDDGGVPLGSVELPDRPILAFGTERHGISAELRERADLVLRIPMHPQVSSLNIAAAAAIALYTLPGALNDPPRPTLGRPAPEGSG